MGRYGARRRVLVACNLLPLTAFGHESEKVTAEWTVLL